MSTENANSIALKEGYTRLCEVIKAVGATPTITQDQFTDMVKDLQTLTDERIASYTVQYGKSTEETLAIMYCCANAVIGMAMEISKRAHSTQVLTYLTKKHTKGV